MGEVGAWMSVVASAGVLPIEIALPIIAAAPVLKLLVAKVRGLPLLGGKIVVRCSKGHVFKTAWSPLGSFRTVRLGAVRFQRCPVGDHWALVKPVKDADLTDEQRRLVDQESD